MAEKAGIVCCIPGCNSIPSPDINFYSFPSDNHIHRDRRKIWISNINKARNLNEPWTPKKHSKVCSKHFVESLQPHHQFFVPTLFPSANQKIIVSRNGNCDVTSTPGQLAEISCQTDDNCNGAVRGEVVEETLTSYASNRYMESGKCVRDVETQTVIVLRGDSEEFCPCGAPTGEYCFHCSELHGYTYIKTEDEIFDDIIEISD